VGYPVTTSIPFETRSLLRWSGVAGAVLWVWGAGASVAHTQEPGKPSQTAPAITVDLGTADGPPGRTVSVPLNIGVPDGVSVTAMDVEIRFEKRLLEFVRVEVTPEATADSVTVTPSTETDPDAQDRSIVKLKATTTKPFRSMAVADLFFRINPKAIPPAGSTGHKAAKVTVVLKRQAQVRMGDGEGKLMAAAGRDGEIDITAGAAIFGCFFYMH
jgi:Cohesin domain